MAELDPSRISNLTLPSTPPPSNSLTTPELITTQDETPSSVPLTEENQFQSSFQHRPAVSSTGGTQAGGSPPPDPSTWTTFPSTSVILRLQDEIYSLRESLAIEKATSVLWKDLHDKQRQKYDRRLGRMIAREEALDVEEAIFQAERSWLEARRGEIEAVYVRGVWMEAFGQMEEEEAPPPHQFPPASPPPAYPGVI
ncbi:hypothetical protein BDY24DRAFT_416454 [Mrakia frigida]|uniref:uncharacterized protein n=1 Tax=Mrakia frigida TaxID=29902 RepID=UPI003FCC01A4